MSEKCVRSEQISAQKINAKHILFCTVVCLRLKISKIQYREQKIIANIPTKYELVNGMILTSTHNLFHVSLLQNKILVIAKKTLADKKRNKNRCEVRLG